MSTAATSAPELHAIADTVGHSMPSGAIATTITCTCGQKFEAPTTQWGDILRAFNKHRRGE